MIQKIRAALVSLAKKSPAVMKFLRKCMLIKDRCRYLVHRTKPVDEKVVLFEAFAGRKFVDSPRAIYEYMLGCGDFDDYRFVWFFTHPEKYRYLEENGRTKVVKHGSDAYFRYYATAGYWITNSRISDAILKRKGQVYLQCWHGTPLKRLGFDIEVAGGNAMNSIADIHYKYSVDAQKYTYMLSPSPFCTEKFISAFNLKAIGREDIIIEEGYPRNDYLVCHSEGDAARVRERLGIPADKKVILYAPTWRDDQHKSGLGYTYETHADFDALRAELEEEYVILFRAHYFVANSFDFERYGGFVRNVSDVDDINELYIIADILITDYSSVFFDYAILKRPIIFYMYDLENYRDDIRGFYISLDELPGPVVQTTDELLGAVCAEFEYDDRYKAFNEKFNCLDDGRASERAVKRVFGRDRCDL